MIFCLVGWVISVLVNYCWGYEFKFRSGWRLVFCVGVLCFFFNIFKGDLLGKLGFDEFKVFWVDLRRWKVMVFFKYKYLVFVCVS